MRAVLDVCQPHRNTRCLSKDGIQLTRIPPTCRGIFICNRHCKIYYRSHSPDRTVPQRLPKYCYVVSVVPIPGVVPWLCMVTPQLCLLQKIVNVTESGLYNSTGGMM